MRFANGRDFESYVQDELLRSAVERQLEIVGEALNHLRKLEPATAEQLPELAAAIGLRNVLIHGYASVDNRLVWDVVSAHLPTLAVRLRTMQRPAASP
ncbi:DUF86 domain-containing protein [Ideonella azotifigens]|nr:DUF86 domain-containing protein [Ideonella azotifigens]